MVLVQCGWIFGTFLIFLFATAASYAIYGVTSVCRDILLDDPEWKCSFPAVGRRVGGFWLYMATVVTQNVTLVMVSTIFIVLGGSQFIALFQDAAGIHFFADDEDGADHSREVSSTLPPFWQPIHTFARPSHVFASFLIPFHSFSLPDTRSGT